jgi:LPS sulfotransferase NodH
MRPAPSKTDDVSLREARRAVERTRRVVDDTAACVLASRETVRQSIDLLNKTQKEVWPWRASPSGRAPD